MESQTVRVNVALRQLLIVPVVLLLTLVARADESVLVTAINAYRSELQSCNGEAAGAVPALVADGRLILPPLGGGDLQQSLTRSGYPLVNVRAISLSGPRDAEAAMVALRESFCQVLLDPQFVDIGVSRDGRDWRIVLARPMLSGGLGDWQAEGQRLLRLINAARAEPRRCGAQSFAAAGPLAWEPVLGGVAEAHSRAMANGNFFGHLDGDGRTPGDRAELAGYAGQQVGETIAAAQDTPQQVLEAWLTIPSYCAALMNPQFSDLGAAYAVDPQSDAGIYWTALFGGP